MESQAYYLFQLIRVNYTTDRIKAILLADRCIRCTGWKGCGRAFCNTCFQALPLHLQHPLYRRFSLDLVEAIHLALQFHLERDTMKASTPTSDGNYDPGVVPESLFPDLPKTYRR